MPRPRTRDPLGVSDCPNIVSDPERVALIQNEFNKKWAYALQSFRVARVIDSRGTVPASLARLRTALERKRPLKYRGERLHPEVEMALTIKAQEFANDRTGENDTRVLQGDIQKAARFLVDQVPVKQGAREDRYLRWHVEGMMALVQEVTGKPVIARRSRNNLYDPHFADPKAQLIFEALSGIDPGVSVTRVVNYICDARRKFAEKPMLYDDFFPGYSGRIELKGINLPIYCP